MFSKDMEQEQIKLSQVREFLKSEIVRLTQLIKEYKEDIKTRGEDFNMDNPNGGMYSGMELTEIHYEMEQKMLYSQEAANDIAFYKVLMNAPYFAKVVFKPEGASQGNPIYIGKRTLHDPDSFKMHVCDWRAPIASLFYEDFDGDAYYEAPRGRIYGELLLKRQFKFENGELVSFIDSDLKIDDDILREVLSSSSGEHLKVIINSIQREQNRVIRYSEGDNLLVTGPAGSGKTSVGFHRLAYLLYQNREELSSSEIIMFSNNDIFSSYVADIIPELGEMPINYTSFYSIFEAEIPTVQVGDYYSLAEEAIKGNEKRLKSASFKMGKAFMDYLQAKASEIEPKFEDVTFLSKTILSKEELLDRFKNDVEVSLKSRAQRISGYIQGKIEEYFLENHDEIFRIVDSSTEVDEDTDKCIRRYKRDVKAKSLDMVKDATILDPILIYFNILSKCASEMNMPEICESEESIRHGFLEFEDAVAIVYLKSVLGTGAVLSGVKHILIDEAQDFSLMQHEIIKRMFPRSRITLLADTNQAIIPLINTIDSEKLAEIYSAKTLNLNKSYRSTKEINEFALSCLPENARYEIFRRDGEPVKKSKGDVTALSERIKAIAEKKRSLCILTKTSEEAREIYNELAEKGVSLRLCDNKSCALSDAPVVMSLALSKGLEFDSVIILDNKGGFLSEENKRYLYLASTRALHRLEIFSLEK